MDVLMGDSDPMRATLMKNIIQWLQFVPSKGDVNEDGTLNIIDVVWTVNIILGITTPTHAQEWSADFNNDGLVNIVDAITLVNEILGPVGTKPVESHSDLHLVHFEIETEQPLAGVQLELAFDKRQCLPHQPRATSPVDGIEVASCLGESEMVILLYSFDGSTIIQEPGAIFELPIEVLDQTPSDKSLWIKGWTFAGVAGQEVSGKVNVSLSEWDSDIPAGFELFQNYPNPFNPETEIRFGVPPGIGDCSVVLTIYNLLGQNVRTLVNGHRDAGYYTVRWDGLNNNGHQVASGLYYYLFEVGDFKTLKKMLFLK